MVAGEFEVFADVEILRCQSLSEYVTVDTKPLRIDHNREIEPDRRLIGGRSGKRQARDL